MSTLILLRGNSGSGKTSVANEIHDILGEGTLLISQDYVRRIMLKVKDKPMNLAIGLIQSMIEYGLNHCEYTIVEGILTEKNTEICCAKSQKKPIELMRTIMT